MRLKQASTDVSKHQLCDRVTDIDDPLLPFLGSLTGFSRIQEQFLEVAEGELIHRIDECEIRDDEVQHSSSDGNWNVGVTRNVDGLLNSCCFF